jgi:hypothetical protein
MIGKKVRVFWPVDGTWYTGTVDRFDASTSEHLLIYPDGDSEWVKIGENNLGPPPADSDPPTGTSRGGIEPVPPMPIADKTDVAGSRELGDHGKYPNDVPLYGYPPYMSTYYPGMPPYMYPPGYPGGMYPGYHRRDNHADYLGDDGHLGGKRKIGPKAWTKEEDALLVNIVKAMKIPMKWSVVAQSLVERTGKQCRERYVNHLNPRLKVTDWNALEDAMVFHLYSSLGSHWAKMSKIIPGRTDNGIKNRFHNLRRQFEREDEHRLRLSSTDEFKDASTSNCAMWHYYKVHFSRLLSHLLSQFVWTVFEIFLNTWKVCFCL